MQRHEELARAAELISRAVSAVPAAMPELSRGLAACLKAARDSLPRVDSPGAGVAQAASRSVGSATMRAAWLATSSEGTPIAVSSLLGEAAGISMRACRWDAPEHRSGLKSDAAPEGWDGPDGGPFVDRSRSAPLAITVRPHLPGGDWSLFCGGIPVMAAESAEACSGAADAILSTLDLGR